MDVRKIIFCLLLIFIFIGVPKAYALDPTQVEPDPSQNGILADFDNCVSGCGSTGFGTSGNYRHGARYIPNESHYLCQADFYIKKNANPTDSLRLDLYFGGTNLTNGTLVASSVAWSASALSGSYQYISFWFGTSSPPGNCYGVQAGQTYFLTLQRSGASDNTNNYQIYVNAGTNAEYTGWSTGSGEVNTPYSVLYGITDGSALDIGIAEPCPVNALYTLCSLFYWLFIPDINTSTINTNIDSLFTLINTKIPFGYINAITEIDLSDSESSESAGWVLPVQAGFVDTSLTFNSNDEAGISDFFGGVRLITTFMFWLGFLAYIYFMMRRVI